MRYFFETSEIATILGVRPDHLTDAIETGRIDHPVEAGDGTLLWGDAEFGAAEACFWPRPGKSPLWAMVDTAADFAWEASTGRAKDREEFIAKLAAEIHRLQQLQPKPLRQRIREFIRRKARRIALALADDEGDVE